MMLINIFAVAIQLQIFLPPTPIIGASGRVTLNENGDRILIYDFSYLDTQSKQYEIALVYDGRNITHTNHIMSN